MIKKITNELNLNHDVLRFMFMRYEEPKRRDRTSGGDRGVKKAAKKEEIMPAVGRIDHLSNEKLEETLEEILK